MLDLLTVEPKFSWPAFHMQLTMRIARRCSWDRQADVQTDTVAF